MAEQDPFAGVASTTQSDDPFAGVASVASSTDPFEGVAAPVKGSSSIPGSKPYIQDKTEKSLGDKSLGLLEAGATALTGTAAWAGGLFGGAQDAFRQGLSNVITGDHSKQVDFKKRADEIAAGLTYEPKGDAGQAYVQKYVQPLGDTMQALGPLAPHFLMGGQVEGAKMLLGRDKVTSKVTAPTDSLSSLRAAIDAKKAAEAAPVVDGSQYAPPTNANPPIVVTPEGVAMPGGTPATEGALHARNVQQDAMLSQLDQQHRENAPMQSMMDQLTPADVPQVEVRGTRDSIGDMSTQLQDRAQAERAAAADKALADRQAALEQEVKRQATLDNNATERQRQGSAGVLEQERADNARKLEQMKSDVEQARLAAESEKMQNMHQVEIDDTQHAGPGEIYGAQYGTHEGVGRVDENGMPIRADRSLEAQQLQNPLQRNLWGDELDPGLGQKRSMTSALDTLQHSVFKGDARDAALASLGEPRAMSNFNQGKRGQGGGLYLGEQVRKAQDEAPVRWFTSSPEAGRKTSYSLESQASRPNAEGQRYGPGQYIAQSRDFSSVYGGPEGRMYHVEAPFERPFDVNKASNERIYQSLVEKTGSRTEANRTLAKAGYDAITFTDPRGNKLANIFNEKPLSDIGPAREKVRQQELTIADYEPGTKTDPFRSQRGMIKMPFSSKDGVDVLKGIPGLREGTRNMRVERISPEEFIAKYKDTPDVNQGVGNKIWNPFTKGSIYMAERLDNPLYSQVTARMREADGLAKGAQKTIVQDIYAPAWRKLNPEEQAKAWGGLKMMEEAKTRRTDDELISYGFNQAERDAIRIHQTVMDHMIPVINQALDSAGLKHINPQAAYVAAKLTGTFRKTMLDANNQVIGALGSNSTKDLARQVAEFKKIHPDAVDGTLQTMGSKVNGGSITDVISYLADKDPHMADFLELSKEASAKQAMDYRGMKTHTMEKKGVIGMEGNKPWESAETNAREGVEAQINYLNRALEWSEKAKAVSEVRPLLDSPELNMPNAKKMAGDYVDFSLGQNPYKSAQIMDSVQNWFNTSFGGNLRGVGSVASGTKSLTNFKLLTGNPGFLLSNILQPLRNMPEVAAYLGAKGMKSTEALGMKSAAKVMSMDATGNWTPIMKEAQQYAKDNHVYASDLIDTRKGISKFGEGDGVGEKIGSAWGAIEHYAQKPASMIEGDTRKAFFLTVVDMLHENGVTKADGLFDIASNMTDRGMNRYSMDEAPILVKALGSAGKFPYNLMSFKFNELSRFASMLAEAGPTPTAMRPVLTSLAMQVAFAGILGTMGYAEANWLVTKFSDMLGKPTSLTKILLDNADKKIVGPVTLKDATYGGLSTATGVDMTNRMGVGSILGQPSVTDQVMPGLSAAGQMATSAWDATTNPSTFNLKKAAVEIPPGGQLLDRFLFSKNKDTDKEMGINRKTGDAKYIRNDADKMAKNLGMTGVNESSKASLGYENQQISMSFDKKRKAAVLNMAQSLSADGKIDPKYIQDYRNAEGKMDGLNATITTMINDQNTPADVRDKLKVLSSNNPLRIQRRFH